MVRRLDEHESSRPACGAAAHRLLPNARNKNIIKTIYNSGGLPYSKGGESMQYIVDQFKALTAIPSPSGFTRAATEYTAKEFEKLGFMPKITNKGCVLVDLGGEGRPLSCR